MKPVSTNLLLAALRLALLLSCLSAGACGGGTAETSKPPPKKLYRFRSQPALQYDTRAADRLPPRNQKEKLLRETVESSWQGSQPALAADGRLDELAAWVVENLEPGGAPPPHAALDTYAHHLGLPEPVPHMMILGLPDDASLEEEVGAEVEKVSGFYPYTHYGAALRPVTGGSLLAVVFGWRWFEMSPVPRAVEPGASIRLQGRITHGLREPVVAVTSPDGSTSRQPVREGPEFEVTIPIEQSGVYRVELLARGERGAAVLANFPVFSGVEEPSAELASPAAAPDQPPEDKEAFLARLLELINQDRSRAGLEPLRLDPELSRVAASHCRDMLDNGFVGHTSPSTGEAHDRVKRAGLPIFVVLENIGRGYGSSEIHEGIMQSPGHRANVLHPDVTHVGLGLVTEQEGSRQSFLVTELFIRRP